MYVYITYVCCILHMYVCVAYSVLFPVICICLKTNWKMKAMTGKGMLPVINGMKVKFLVQGVVRMWYT